MQFQLGLYKPEIQKQTDERLRSGSERRIASRIRPGQDSKTLQNFQDLQDQTTKDRILKTFQVPESKTSRS